jgi:hypothetical protein
MLGHASAAITLDVYADLFDDDLDTVAVALDRAALQTDVGGAPRRRRVADLHKRQNPRMTGGSV